MTRFKYYETSRIKKLNGSDNYWWNRSPNCGQNAGWCNINTTGGGGVNPATLNFGIAVHGCI